MMRRTSLGRPDRSEQWAGEQESLSEQIGFELVGRLAAAHPVLDFARGDAALECHRELAEAREVPVDSGPKSFVDGDGVLNTGVVGQNQALAVLAHAYEP